MTESTLSSSMIASAIPSQIPSQIPALDQRLKRLKTVDHGPYCSGRPRHGNDSHMADNLPMAQLANRLQKHPVAVAR